MMGEGGCKATATPPPEGTSGLAWAGTNGGRGYSQHNTERVVEPRTRARTRTRFTESDWDPLQHRSTMVWFIFLKEHLLFDI